MLFNPSDSSRIIVHKTFIAAGIAYYLSGDWRALIREGKNHTIGHHQTVLAKLLNASDEKFGRVIERFIDDYAYEVGSI